MITSKLLLTTNIVSHGFFNKKNGFSKGLYKGLNCGRGSGDKKKYIKKNLNYVKNKLKSKKIILLYYIKFTVQNSFLLKSFLKKK